MAFRSNEMVKKIMKKIGGDKNSEAGVKESLKKCLPGRLLVDIFSLVIMTRRNWKPNVQEQRLFSYILDRLIRVKVTTHAIRCIDKAGGID
nr:hypothetical protein [Tanacetum cinerariifolium]